MNYQSLSSIYFNPVFLLSFYFILSFYILYSSQYLYDTFVNQPCGDALTITLTSRLVVLLGIFYEYFMIAYKIYSLVLDWHRDRIILQSKFLDVSTYFFLLAVSFVAIKDYGICTSCLLSKK